MDAEHKVYLWYLIIAVIALCIGYWIGKETTACASEFMIGSLNLPTLPNIPSLQQQQANADDEKAFGAFVASRAYSRGDPTMAQVSLSAWKKFYPNFNKPVQITSDFNPQIIDSFTSNNCIGAALFSHNLIANYIFSRSSVQNMWNKYFAKKCGNFIFKST